MHARIVRTVKDHVMFCCQQLFCLSLFVAINYRAAADFKDRAVSRDDAPDDVTHRDVIAYNVSNRSVGHATTTTTTTLRATTTTSSSASTMSNADRVNTANFFNLLTSASARPTTHTVTDSSAGQQSWNTTANFGAVAVNIRDSDSGGIHPTTHRIRPGAANVSASGAHQSRRPSNTSSPAVTTSEAGDDDDVTDQYDVTCDEDCDPAADDDDDDDETDDPPPDDDDEEQRTDYEYQTTYYNNDETDTAPSTSDNRPLDVAIEYRESPDYHIGAEYHDFNFHLSKRLSELGIHDLKGRAISLRWLEERNRRSIKTTTNIWLSVLGLTVAAVIIAAMYKHRHLAVNLMRKVRCHYKQRTRWQTSGIDEANVLLANAQV